MTILANRRTADWTQPHAYRIYFNINTGAIEFTARGTNGAQPPISLVGRPYLDRWYHLAVVRSGDLFFPYVDGRLLPTVAATVGNTSTTDGVTIGGFLSQERFWGEIQEVAIFQKVRNRSEIVANTFQDIAPALVPELRGYYKLGFSTTVADRLKNFAVTPPTGTEAALAQGTGTIEFPETDKNGEQSLFDTRKNDGRDATGSLAANFTWRQMLFSRPTVGVPFELGLNYSSSNAYSGQPLEGGVNIIADDSVLGSGWRHSLQTRLISADLFLSGIGGTAYVGMLTAEGSLETWKRETRTRYTPTHGEYRGELGEDATGDYMEWVTPGRQVFKYYHPGANLSYRGKLAEIRDFNSPANKVALNYDAGSGRLLNVVDSAGGVWMFTYNAQDLLTSVSGPSTDATQKWTVAFSYDSQKHLISKTLTGPAAYTPVSSTEWKFFYAGGAPESLLERIVDPRGFDDVRVGYDTYGRKVSVRDARNRTVLFDYNKPAIRQLTTTAVHGSDIAQNRVTIDTFDRKLRLISAKNPLGQVTNQEYDAAGNVTAAVDARGARTTMTYDARANVLSRTNALGETTRWEYSAILAGGTLLNKPTKEIRPATAEAPTGWENRYAYDGAGNLLTHKDGPPAAADFGTLATHAYDARGLVSSSKDANNNEARFAYDASTGFLTAKTIAFGTTQAATWNFTRSELGWLLSETNPLSQRTATDYNVYGQPIRVVDPVRTVTKEYDANGNLTAESDADARFTRYIYNEADERTQKTDRAGSVWDYSYSPFGELIVTTAPEVLSDGVMRRDTVTRAYDLAGRLVREADPVGDFASYEYDVNGNQTAMVDKLSRRWEKTYDAVNRVIAERDPEGNVRRTSFDAAGRIQALISPNGAVSSHEYDGRGRLVKWTDPERFVWRYVYDGVGNITRITDALGGNYDMTYGPRNERLTEKNQDGQSWNYAYDVMARLKTQADPNGNTRSLTYDAVSRLTEVAFGSGRINTLGYDRNNNLKSLTRTKAGSPSTSLALSYDSLDRLIVSQDTFAKSVGYSYDALGRVVTKTYPGERVLTHTYDRLGRLKGLSFAVTGGGPARTSAFTYDKAGRLISRTYPNGLVQENVFDTSGRLTSLSYKQGGTALIALGYAYDRNGNKTGGTEIGTLPWSPAAITNYDDASRFTPAGKLVDRTDAGGATPKVFTYEYDASGNMKRAVSGAESYALAYDEDNRTTSITYANGAATMTVENRYDGLGRRVARTLGGSETRYVLDLVGDMERILCETDATGAPTAWFVHGPDLSFKIAANGDLTCYHADAMGNIIRTTDGAAATINQYAYTPYGRRVATSGTTTWQPYTFVGSQGVMEELPGLFFMRARYYSANAAAFLSTDPVTKIGPSWKPNAYGYANENSLNYFDAKGEFALPAIIVGAALGAISESLIIDYEILFQHQNYTVGQVLSKIAGATVAGGLVGAAAPLALEGAAEFAATGLAGYAGVLVDRGLSSAFGQPHDSSLADDIVESLIGHVVGHGIDKATPGIGGAKGLSTWGTQAYKQAAARVERSFLGGMVFSNSKAASDLLIGGSSGPGQTPSGAQPGKATSSGSPATYTVKAGDTLGNIASRNGTTATALGAANGIKNLNVIRPGQVLKISR